jgi:hypothetical protein
MKINTMKHKLQNWKNNSNILDKVLKYLKNKHGKFLLPFYQHNSGTGKFSLKIQREHTDLACGSNSSSCT